MALKMRLRKAALIDVSGKIKQIEKDGWVAMLVCVDNRPWAVWQGRRQFPASIQQLLPSTSRHTMCLIVLTWASEADIVQMNPQHAFQSRAVTACNGGVSFETGGTLMYNEAVHAAELLRMSVVMLDMAAFLLTRLQAQQAIIDTYAEKITCLEDN